MQSTIKNPFEMNKEEKEEKETKTIDYQEKEGMTENGEKELMTEDIKEKIKEQI